MFSLLMVSKAGALKTEGCTFFQSANVQITTEVNGEDELNHKLCKV